MPRLPTAADVQGQRLVSDPGVSLPRGLPRAVGLPTQLVDTDIGLEGVQRSLNRISDRVVREVEKQQTLKDMTETTRAEIAFEEQATAELTRRQQEGDPTSGEFSREFGNYLETESSSVLGGLEGVSEEAKVRLQARLASSRLKFQQSAGAIQIKAQAELANDTFGQKLNVLSAQASQYPGALPELLGEVDTTLEGFAPALGQNATRDARADARLQLIESTVGGLTEAGQYRAAEQLLKSGEYDEDIPAASRNTLLNVIDRGRRAEAAEVRSLFQDHYASIQETGAGIPGLEGKAASVLEGDELAGFRRSVRLAEDVHDAFADIRVATPEQMAERIASFRPEPGTVGFADRQQVFETLRESAQRELKARAADPAAYVMQRMPEVAKRFDGAESLDSPIAVRLDAQERLGIPPYARRALAKPEAQEIVAQLGQVPATLRAQQLAALEQTYGRHWDRVFGELVQEGLDPQTATLAAVAGDPGVSQTLAQAIETGAPELKKGLPETSVRDLRETVGSELAPFLQAFTAGDPSGSSVEQANGIIASAETLGLSYLRTRFPDDPNAAAKKAYEDIVGKRFEVIDGDRVQAFVPKVYNNMALNVSEIEDGAEALLTRETVEAFDPLPIGDIFRPERPVQPSGSPVVDSVKRRFGALAQYDFGMIDSRDGGISDGRKIEFYPPDERDNPRPGQFTVEVFDPNLRGDDLVNIIGAEFLHYLGKEDPAVVKLRERFRKSITPEQAAVDRRAYERAVAGEFGDPERRPYDEWFEIHRLDQYLGAMMLPEGSANRQEWMRVMTPEQREILGEIESYLKHGGDTGPDFLDRERTIRTAVNSGYWVTNPTNTGLALMVPFSDGSAIPLVNREGQPYEVTFDELMRQGSTARARDDRGVFPGEGAP